MSPSPQRLAQEDAPLNLFSPLSPSSSCFEGWRSRRPFSVTSTTTRSRISSREDGIISLQDSGIDDPVDYSWNTQLNETIIPTVSRGSSVFGPYEVPNMLPLSMCDWTASVFYMGKDNRCSTNRNFPGGPRNPGSSFNGHSPSFATLITPIISRMLSGSGSLASMIPMGVGSVLESAILNTTHSEASRILKRQTIDHQSVYLIFHRLINDGNAVRGLIEPKTKLDHFFNMGIRFCFSLGNKALSTAINSMPPPYKLALIQNLFRVALIMGHELVLSVIINMGQENLVNRPVVLGDSQYYPLEYTAICGHIQATQVLLDHGADPNQQEIRGFLDRIGKHPHTQQSSPSTRTHILRLLIGRGLEVVPHRSLFRGYRHRDEILLLANHYLDKSFEIFFRRRALPNVLSRQNWDDSLSQLLQRILDRAHSDKNVDCNVWSTTLSESLSCAVLRSHTSAVEILLATGAKPSLNCLISAARSNNLRILEDSLNIGLDPNTWRSTPFAHTTRHDPIYEDQDSDQLFSCTALSESIRNHSREAFGILQARGFVLQLANQPTSLASALIAACEVGDSTLVEQLFSLRILPQSLPGIGQALRVTINNNHQHIVQQLLSVGIKPDIYCLESAIKSKNLAIIELLVELTDISVNPWSIGSVDGIMIFEALRWNDEAAIEHLLRMGHPINILKELKYSQLKDWNIPSSLRLPGNAQSWAFTPLSAAVLQGNPKAVRDLIACGAQVVLSVLEHSLSACHGITPIPLTPLAAAIVRQDIDLVRDFFRMGADPFDNGALFICAVLSLEAIITMVLSAFRNRYTDGAKAFGSEALCYSIRLDNTRLVGVLAKDADIFGHITIKDDRDRENPANNLSRPLPPPPPPGRSTAFTSPLGEAIRLHSTCSGTDVMLELLLSLVKDLDAVIYQNLKHGSMTCLTYAISLGSLNTVQKLHQAGADIFLPAEWRIRRTPLQAAAQAGSMDIVEYLLGQGVSPNQAPAKIAGGTALQLAAIKGHIGIAAALLDVGAEINAKPAVMDGRTAFEGATEHGRIEMMLFLVHHGADLLADDSRQYRRAVLFAEDNLQYAAKELADQLHAKAMASVGTSFIGMGECGWTGFDMDDFTEFLP